MSIKTNDALLSRAEQSRAEQSRAEQSRAEWISTLRGIAALLVFISHLTLNWQYSGNFILGRIGVVEFFLITGYLTYSSRRKRSCKQYLFNRFMRMYPTYWVLLILSWLVFTWGEFPVAKLLANITLFQEFLGFDNIIGASWMMPIQVCFFMFIGILGVKIVNEKTSSLFIGAFTVISIISGLLRNVTGKPFPTAFPLLINMALIGMTLFYFYEGAISIKKVWINIAIFEVGLIIGACLSYSNWWAYLVAYNIGLILFVLWKQFNIHMTIFDKLGEIGFSFFLGAWIIYTVLVNVGICGQGEYMNILDCIIQFITALILAYLVTRFVEKPVLRWAQKIENKMR